MLSLLLQQLLQMCYDHLEVGLWGIQRDQIALLQLVNMACQSQMSVSVVMSHIDKQKTESDTLFYRMIDCKVLKHLIMCVIVILSVLWKNKLYTYNSSFWDVKWNTDQMLFPMEISFIKNSWIHSWQDVVVVDL